MRISATKITRDSDGTSVAFFLCQANGSVKRALDCAMVSRRYAVNSIPVLEADLERQANRSSRSAVQVMRNIAKKTQPGWRRSRKPR